MATSHKYKTPSSSKEWTYGSELEFVDWPRLEPLPKGMAIDDGNYTSVNSNGVAVDGKGKTYHLGGEILTAPSASIDAQAEQMMEIKKRWPETTYNYRTGLNVHVRVPGLRDNLKKLKQLQRFTHKVMPDILPILDPIPVPSTSASALEKKCYRVRLRDHHTLLPKWRLDLQLSAKSTQEFFEAEAIHVPTGKVHWAIAPRTCVNLRQLLQTDTVEFRHFFMPYTPEELTNTLVWAKTFLEAAFDGGQISFEGLLGSVGFYEKEWPEPLPYNSWLDEGFFYTSPHHNPPNLVAGHIADWLARNKNKKVYQCPRQ